MDDDETTDGRRGRWGTLATVIVIILVTGGIAYVHHRTNGIKSSDITARSVSLNAYFLGDTATGQRLFSERHTLTEVTSSDLQAAVNTALGIPDDPDYHSGFPIGTSARVHDHHSYVTIDFDSGDVADAKPLGGDQAMALQALVWTVDEVLGDARPVRFAVNGSPATRLLRAPVAEQYVRGSAAATLSPVSLQLDEGSAVARGALVEGEAEASAGPIVWKLVQGEQVVRHGNTTAAQCCRLVPFQLRVDAPPGSYTLEVSSTARTGGKKHSHGTPDVTTDSKDIQIE